MNVVQPVEELQGYLLPLSRRELHVRVLEKARQIVLAELEHEENGGLELAHRLGLGPTYLLGKDRSQCGWTKVDNTKIFWFCKLL